MRVATQYAPARCTPDAAAQLQPIPYACGAQRSLLAIAVGSMNINDLMNINDVRVLSRIQFQGGVTQNQGVPSLLSPSSPLPRPLHPCILAAKYDIWWQQF